MLLRWLWRKLLPDFEVVLDDDPEVGDEELPPFTWFRDLRGNATVINTEDLPEAIAAEYENAAGAQEMAVDTEHRWVLDHDGIREIIAIAIEADDEDLALMTVIANTNWHGSEDEDPFL